MCYPRVEINLVKIRNNTKKLVEMCNENNIDVVGVTKVFCGKPKIVREMVKGGIRVIGDSRIENLKKLKRFKLPKLLLRLPMISEAEEVVQYADISLNSEISTIRRLSKEAKKRNLRHKIILMVDLGDLREGIFDEEEIFETVEIMISLDNIDLIGIGTNLTCYGGILPEKSNLQRLLTLKETIRKKYKLNLKVVSGGNSSSLHLIEEGDMPKGINQLRLGESIVLGRETAYGNTIEDTYQDAMTLQCEIIELQDKPSLPIGTIGMDAFGNVPSFNDKGIRKRAICAIGRQDVDPTDILPGDKNVEIIGSSSDHLILDVTDSNENYSVGSILRFSLKYGSVLSLFTSEYVKKIYV
ncbi:ornithine racemase Orr [Vallitalea guaymasensis]|uniref:ornithine racemase n=1 Tax=Vallitalea guaymasensis TaxID=1185412 RepID=A0A8J8MDZ7_9FIRM|nr:ornithine racemase Orr [Vallitalea guaymasensis]QUH30905.1 alanine/ornithine racemase family PLP-dependent enzyme [Vallitalea guaymasensis]